MDKRESADTHCHHRRCSASRPTNRTKMKIASVDSDEENADDTNEERGPKRVRSDGGSRTQEFLDRQREPAFREQHHPEKLVTWYLAQRQHALTALPAFVSDMKTGALNGPRAKGPGVLKVRRPHAKSFAFPDLRTPHTKAFAVTPCPLALPL